MKKLLIFLMLVVQGFAMGAQTLSTTVDGVVYTAVYDDKIEVGGCRVTGCDETCPSAIIILPEVEIDGKKSTVKRINNNAISSVVKEILIKKYDNGTRNFQIQAEAFFDCTNLEKVTLPSDLTNFSTAIFVNNAKLQTIVFDREDPNGIIIAAADALLDGKVQSYMSLMEKVKLYVPDKSVETYKSFEADKNNNWPNNAFWSVFDVRPMSELENEVPGPVQTPEGIRIPLTDGGAVVMLDAVPGHRIQLPGDNGCVFISATFNGEDASKYIEGNIFTVPEYSGVADFKPVFEMIQSGVEDMTTDDVDIRINGNTVEVSSAGRPVSVEIYNVSGQQVYSGEGSSVTLDNGVYILKAAGRTFKFAL